MIFDVPYSTNLVLSYKIPPVLNIKRFTQRIVIYILRSNIRLVIAFLGKHIEKNLEHFLIQHIITTTPHLRRLYRRQSIIQYVGQQNQDQ